VIVAAVCRPQRPARDESTLVVAVRADVAGIFPNQPFVFEAFTVGVNANMFEGLIRYDNRLLVEPALAERWEDVDDRTCVLVLRPGLLFSDGRPVTSRDVVASLLAVQRRHWPSETMLRSFESVRALDDRRVEVRSASRDPLLVHRLYFGFVFPAAVVDAEKVPPVGTGPYRLVAWRPGEELLLERNRHFRGPAPDFEKVRLKVIPQAEARIRAVVRGEADLADHIPLRALERLKAQPALRVVTRATNRILFLALRTDQEPFCDPRVRQAVDVALDREELIRRALGGVAQPASQIVTREIVGYNPELGVTQPDRERARRLLQEAGYGAGLAVRLDGTNNRYVNDSELLGEIARQLGEVGIQVTVNALDKRELFPLIHTGRSKLHMIGWGAESGDAADGLRSFLHSPSSDLRSGSGNTVGLADAELDRVIDEAAAIVDSAKRAAALRAVVKRVADLHALVPLLVQTEAVALSQRIVWEPGLNFALRFDQVHRAR
jgi:peptide/nickel transport system substrate-binding protein